MEEQPIQQQLSDLQKEMDNMKTEMDSLKKQFSQLQGIPHQEDKRVRESVKDSRPKNDWLKVAIILGGILIWLLLEKHHFL